MKCIAVFCGSNLGSNPEFTTATQALARCLVNEGLKVVYGGGCVGLMGILANEVLRVGGEIRGVIPRALFTKELAHPGLTELHVVESMHQRKNLMYELSDGFIALPGGLGTLEEIGEILTWSQLGFHRKPCGILNVCGYYNFLLQFFDHAQKNRLLLPEHRRIILSDDSPEDLLKKLKTFRPSPVKKWKDAEK